MTARGLASSIVASLAFAVPAQAASGPVGTLSQPGGDAGCYSDDGFSTPGSAASGTCTNVRGLRSGYAGALSPDGKFFYVANGDDGIAAFARDSGTGVLTQLAGKAGCLTEDGTLAGGDEGAVGCVDARALSAPYGIAISPDGKFLYTASEDVGEIAAFARDQTTGALTQLDGTAGCLSNTGAATADPGAIGCVDGRGLGGGYQLVMSADGRTLYIPGLGGRVAILRRDPATGAVSQPSGAEGCVSNDGSASVGDPGGVGCGDARALGEPASLALSPDGKFAYVQSINPFETAIFRVNTVTGALLQLGGVEGCVSNNGLASGDPGAVGCVNARAVGDFRVLVSRDGHNVYTTSYFADQIAVFARDTSTGTLTQLSGNAGCLSNNGTAFDPGDPASTCTDVRALDGVYPLIEGPEGTQLITGGYDGSEWAVFTRDPATGALSQDAAVAGCVSETGLASGDPGAVGCTDVRGSRVATAAVLSSDGRWLYLVGASRAVGVFERQVAPVCAGASATTPFGTPVEITLSCSDANGDALTITAAAPEHGTVGAVTSGKVTYSPAVGFTGADTFTFSASDGSVSSSPATAALTVGAAPKPKAAFPAIAATARTVDAKGRFRLGLSCPAGTTACGGTLTVRTDKAVAVAAAKKPRKRVVRLARKAYLLAPGATATLPLRLSKAGRALLARSSPIKARVVMVSASPRKTKTLRGFKLKRRR